MAVLNLKVADLANLDLNPKVFAPSINRGKLRRHYFHLPALTVAGDANSTVDLALLPPGAVRLYVDRSHIYWSAFGAARVLDIGHAAYEEVDGAIEAASLALFDDNVDVAAAGNAALGSDFAVPAGRLAKTQLFMSSKGVIIRALVTGGTIPIGAILEGWLEYSET